MTIVLGSESRDIADMRCQVGVLAETVTMTDAVVRRSSPVDGFAIPDDSVRVAADTAVSAGARSAEPPTVAPDAPSPADPAIANAAAIASTPAPTMAVTTRG